MRSLLWFITLILGGMLLLFGGCSDDTGNGDECPAGMEKCPCMTGNTCYGDLTCRSGVCLDETGNTDGDADADSDADCGDTSSDPLNCGTCGHVCKSGKCVRGNCSPKLAECITKSSGFTTCEANCVGVGQICVAQGCSDSTYVTYGIEKDCNTNTSLTTSQTMPCTDAIDWSGRSYIRCCCVDLRDPGDPMDGSRS